MSDKIRNDEAGPEPPQPLFNVPWPITTVVGVLVALHIARLLLGLPAGAFALTREAMAQGRWGGLLSHIFVHAGWAHLAMNSAAILTFGAPLARYASGSWRGALAVFGLFLLSGVAGALGFAAVHPSGGWALVGASGAASGFFGASARLIEGRGRLGPLFGPLAMRLTLAFIAVNAVLGLTGLTPGAAGLTIAWEAHAFGCVAGLLLAGPAAWVAGGSRVDHALSH